MSKYQTLEKKIGYKIMKLQSVDSTNDYAAKLIKSIRETKELYKFSGLVVCSENQTAGKGTEQNTWESETGKNLTFSIVLTPFFIKPIEQFLISKVISLGIFDYIEEKKLNVKIKWPNDIYVNNKKIAGILIENSLQQNTIITSIVGIGININQKQFSAQIKNPTSLFIETKQEFDLQEELKILIQKIQNRYNILCNKNFSNISKDYFEKLYKKDTFVKYKTEKDTFYAKIIQIDEIGRIVLQTKDRKKHTFAFKEVELINE